MRRHSIAGIVGGVLIFLLAGGTGPAASWVAEMKAPPPAPSAAVAGGPATQPVPAAVSEAPGYIYLPAGKPDPFMPFIELDLALKKKQEAEQMKNVEQKKAAAKGRPISPLQQAEIEQFRLVGIAGDENRRTAIVEDGVAKKHYPLFVGTYIGMNGGRIVSIQPDRVIVEERLQDQTKKAKKAKVRRITVMLHKEDEGKP
jgi:type IV pilus assembly protein PilP